MPDEARQARSAAQGQDEPRGWVVRLGHYLRIFGKPERDTEAWDGRDQLDRMIEIAKEREDEHGR